MKSIFLCFLCILILWANAFAQTSSTSPTSKIAMIDTHLLLDRKEGIKGLAELRGLIYFRDSDFSLVVNPRFQKESAELEGQIQLRKCQNKPTDELDERLKRIKADFAQAEDADKALTKKREEEWLEPQIKQIREKLNEFAAKSGYLLVIDKGSTSLGNPIMEGNGIQDITKDFIKFYNDYLATKLNK